MLGALAVLTPTLSEWTVGPAIATSLASLLLLASLGCAAIGTFPRTSGPKASLIYFGGITARDLSQYEAAMLSVSDDDYFVDLVRQSHRNAQIAQKKYMWIRVSMACLFVSTVPWGLSLFLLYSGQP